MYELELFLGLEINDSLQAKLSACNPHLKKEFIKNGSDYLHTTTCMGKTYLGKHLGDLCKLDRFDFLCTNIYSILKRLTSSPCETYPLSIFVISKENKK